jgi:hypothetical protein
MEWGKEYTVDSTRVWQESIKQNIISDISHRDFEIGRGMSWGE